MHEPVRQASVPWKMAEKQLGAGLSLTHTFSSNYFPRLGEAVPTEGFLGNPGRKRKPLGEGQEK